MKPIYKNTILSQQICGTTYEPLSQENLQKKDAPIRLAQVEIDTAGLSRIKTKIVYSNFISLSLGKDALIDLTFRLTKRKKTADNKSEMNTRLEHWNLISEASTIVIDDTITPFQLRFFDQSRVSNEKKIIYMIDLNRIITRNASYKIVNQSMTALITNEPQ
ncbi:DUF4489 domain-containing protein [Hazenella sp. IB182357]|uniref:DUF4489 domain-containing protein n=1 Tax=Polycladospora coralii TaxID=2771432 RepID=A0A926RV49_9BACL|nr:DUF4489 domain-containing protein [Polycladospora coralii]MBD1373783.1 DUF4489 domain-containing protein [Polycladospora coralii]